MSFTTVAFFVFLLAGIVVYYVLPKNVQWIWLLILSYLYYFTFSIKASLFMVFATVTIYFGGIWLQNIQNTGDRYLKDNNKDITTIDIDEAISEIVPVYNASKEKIVSLEKYAENRARFASREAETNIAPKRKVPTIKMSDLRK